MNNLKFRAWSKAREEMINDCDLAITSNGSILAGDLDYMGNSSMCPDVTDNVVIMMSTGLKDILGNDIYEGDIVKVLVKDEDPKIMEDKIYTGIIVYEQGVFDVKTFDDTRLGIIPQMYMSDVDCVFRVLGNIYENKELLEDK